MKKYLVIGLLVLGLGSASVYERYAFAGLWFGGRHGGEMRGAGPGPGMLFPMILRAVDLTPAQKSQVADIMARHRAHLEPLFTQVRAAHGDLASKLFAPGTVTAADLAPGIERLGRLKQQLLQEWTQAALETRAVLTPEQRAKAAEVKQRLDTLRAEIDKLLGPPPMLPGDPAE